MSDERESDDEIEAEGAQTPSDKAVDGASSKDEVAEDAAAPDASSADDASAEPAEVAEEDTPTGGRNVEDTNGGSAVADSGLASTLLAGPLVEADDPKRPYSYPIWARLLVSVFVLYHASVLIVENLPAKGLSKGLMTWFNKKLEARDYFRATGNSQSWAMFAPNPHRSNIFMKVLVKDEKGEIYDLKHDIYGKRTYPYLFYDRMGKVNRRIVDQKGYRRHYAAWVCRDWERTHGGEALDEVIFVKMWTKIPHPDEVVKRWKQKRWDLRYLGYHPLELKLHEREADTFRCKTTRHAQLPNYLRERYGLPIEDDNYFRGLNIRTWFQKQEQEKRAAERRARLEENRSRRHGQ